MKKLFARTIFLCFLFISFLAQAEIYSWVDKDGKKHFGEVVPKEYQHKSKNIDVKSVNTMEAVTPSPQEPERTVVAPSSQDPAPKTIDDDSQNLSACEKQKRGYQESVACFSRCQGDGYVNNISACKNCIDVKKPSCD